MRSKALTHDPKLSALLRQLPTLNAAELRQVDMHARALLNLSPAGTVAPTEITGNTDYLLEGCYAEARRRGLLAQANRLPESRLRQMAPNYAEDSARVWELLLSHMPYKLRAAEKHALAVICARALADHLERVVPPGLRTLLLNVGKMPEALDASYPGYLRSGLLKLLVTQAR